MSEPTVYETVTSDGFEVSSNTSTAEDMSLNFGTPEEATPESTPVETPTPEPVAETVDPILEQHADGSFKQKAKKGSLNELRQNIAKATWEREEAKREAAALKAEVESLKATRPAEARPEPVRPAAAPAQTFPDYAAWEAQNSGKSYEDYIDARADWKFDQREAATQQQAAFRQQQDAMGRVEVAGLAAHPDFLDKLSAVVAAGLQFPPLLSDAILSEDPTLGHALAYEYATHLEDLRRLSALPPAKAALAIGKTLARLEAPHSGSVSSAPVLSKANPPIQPVASSPTTDADEPSDEESLDAHILRYNARERKAGRR